MKPILVISFLTFLFGFSILEGQAPILLKDLNSYPKEGKGSFPHSFFGIGGRVLFVAQGKGVGRELFVSSGSAAGTRVLADLNPGPKDSDLQLYGVRGGKLFFFRTRPGGGKVSQELWVSDGSPVGTKMVRGSFPGFPSRMVGLGRFFYFFTWDVVQNRPVLFRTDGTTKGTRSVYTGNSKLGLSLIRIFDLIEWKGSLFFLSLFKDAKGTRFGLFRSDGSTSGTGLVVDFPKAQSPASVPALFPIGLELRIGLEEHNIRPFSLYLSKGTKASTRRGSLPVGVHLGSQPMPVVSDGFHLFWIMTTPKYGKELWVSDGTLKGSRVLDLSPGTKGSLVSLGTPLFGGLLFAAQPNGGVQGLYLSDGSLLGARRLCDLPFSSSARDVAVLGNQFVFANQDLRGGDEPWISDGTRAGTRRLVDLEKGGRGSHPRRFAAAMGRIFFASSTKGFGEDPWWTNGTSGGTQLLARPNPPIQGTGDGNPFSLMARAVEGIFFFRAEDPQRGIELWGTDGTPMGTMVLGDLEPGKWGSNPGQGISLGGKFLFAATRIGVGRELFASNGTPNGTGLLLDLQPGSGSGDPRRFFRVGNKVFFNAETLATGRELWVTDGTPAKTGLVRDLQVGPASSNPQPLAAIGGRLLFQAEKTKGVPGLFLGDGTANGTISLLNPKRTVGLKKILGAHILGESILFYAQNLVNGLELWKSRGKKGDAGLLIDLLPGRGDGVLNGGFVFEKTLYFLGRKTTGKYRLFQSDGTPLGTKVVPQVSVPLLPFQFLSHLPSVERGKLFGFKKETKLGQGTVALFLLSRGTGNVQKVGQFTVLEGSKGQVFGNPFPQLGTRFAYFEALDKNGFPRLFRTDGSVVGTHPIPLSSPLKETRIIGALPRGLLLAANDPFIGRELFLWDPGALSLPRGIGCDGVSLQGLDPVFGRPLLLGGKGTGGFGLLFMGFPLNPGFEVFAGSGCRFLMNPLQPLFPLPILVSRGFFATSIPLPKPFQLNGFRLSIQAATFNPNLGRFSLSNAMDFRLGY